MYDAIMHFLMLGTVPMLVATCSCGREVHVYCAHAEGYFFCILVYSEVYVIPMLSSCRLYDTG